MTAQRKILLIALAAVAFAGIFVVLEPGPIAKDASEYHALAESILQGRYALHGQPSMLREPGYPLFRALFLAVGAHPTVILWAQALLYGLIVWLIGDAVRRIESRAGPWAAFGALCAYGLAVYASKHLLEIFATTLASIVLWMMVRACTATRRLSVWILLIGVLLGALLLTRTTFLFLVPLVAFGLGLDIQKREGVRRGWLTCIGVIGIAILVVSPWALRNHAVFGEWNIAGKAGSQVFIRAWKATLPGERLAATMGSILVGQSLFMQIAPTTHPVIFEQWDLFNARDRAAAAAGVPVQTFQREIQAEGIRMLLHPRALVFAAFWTGAEELRLFALPSPLSREFSIEAMFAQRARDNGMLSATQTLILLVAHAVQLVWWILAFVSVWWGFRRYGVRFVPGWMVLAIALAYAPADTIVRYAAPAHPWLFASIAWMLTMTRPWERVRAKNAQQSASQSPDEHGR